MVDVVVVEYLVYFFVENLEISFFLVKKVVKVCEVREVVRKVCEEICNGKKKKCFEIFFFGKLILV